MVQGLNSKVEEILKQIAALQPFVRNADARTQTILHEIVNLDGNHSQTQNLVRSIYIDNFIASKATGNFKVKTKRPVALDSADHLLPNSTVEGLDLCLPFVDMCIDKFGNDMKVLDIGTGAGGLVAGFLTRGILALGLDGTDNNKKRGHGYWPNIPNHLITCDATRPFEILDSTRNEDKCQFNVITMWEVLEHIDQTDLSQVFHNIVTHLSDDGFFVASVSLVEHHDGSGTNWHPTLLPKPWWEEQLKNNGLMTLDDHPFDVGRFCRGNGPRHQDLYDYQDDPTKGFWLVAQKAR